MACASKPDETSFACVYDASAQEEATERVYHSRTMPSQVKVGVVPREALRPGNE